MNTIANIIDASDILIGIISSIIATIITNIVCNIIHKYTNSKKAKERIAIQVRMLISKMEVLLHDEDYFSANKDDFLLYISMEYLNICIYSNDLIIPNSIESLSSYIELIISDMNKGCDYMVLKRHYANLNSILGNFS